jgi:mono/diheme cytochrome c family protein
MTSSRRLRWNEGSAAIGGPWLLGLLVALAVSACGGGGASYRNPSPADPEAIARGATLYSQHCESCHGLDGLGGGPEAAGLTPPPANLVVHVPHHQEVVLFEAITNGVGGTSMAAWEDDLTEGERWDLVNYLVAEFGGEALQAGGGASNPLAFPTTEGDPGARIQQMSVSQFYATNCAGCHGAERQGIVGPALTPERLVAADEVYVDAIANGLPGTVMPSWKRLAGLSDAEILLLVEWLKTDGG